MNNLFNLLVRYMSIIFMLACLSNCFSNETKASSKTIESILGEKAYDLIENTTAISITPLAVQETSYPHPLKALSLNKQEVSILKNAILSESSYRFDIVKMNVFFPEFLIKFYGAGEEEVSFLLSLQSHQMCFYQGGPKVIIELSNSFYSTDVLNIFIKLLNKD